MSRKWVRNKYATGDIGDSTMVGFINDDSSIDICNKYSLAIEESDHDGGHKYTDVEVVVDPQAKTIFDAKEIYHASIIADGIEFKDLSIRMEDKYIMFFMKTEKGIRDDACVVLLNRSRHTGMFGCAMTTRKDANGNVYEPYASNASYDRTGSPVFIDVNDGGEFTDTYYDFGGSYVIGTGKPKIYFREYMEGVCNSDILILGDNKEAWYIDTHIEGGLYSNSIKSIKVNWLAYDLGDGADFTFPSNIEIELKNNGKIKLFINMDNDTCDVSLFGRTKTYKLNEVLRITP